MANRRPLYVTNAGGLAVLAAPDLIDSSVLPVSAAGSTLAGLTDVDVSTQASGTYLRYAPPATGGYDAVIAAEAALTHFYKCNEPAGGTVLSDAKGTANLTLVGGATLGAAALISDSETAVSFDGTSGYAISPTNVLPLGNLPVSIEFFVRFTISATYTSFFSTSDQALSLYSSDPGSGSVFSGNPNSGLITSFAFASNTLYHIAYTWDGTTGSYYVNGALQGTLSTGPTTASGVTCYFGGFPGPLYFVNGRMSKLAIYNAALSASAVATHYNARTQTGGGSSKAYSFVSPLTHGDYVDLPNTQTIAGAKTFSIIPAWTGALPVAQGGTGATAQNFVDLTTSQTIAGLKTFSTIPAWTGALPLLQGGTGSTTKNFCDISTTQTIGGAKTFSSALVVSSSLSATSVKSGTGYAPPVYTPAGAALASTTKEVIGSATIALSAAISGSVTVTLTGLGIFASTAYLVTATPVGTVTSPLMSVFVTNVSTSSFTLSVVLAAAFTGNIVVNFHAIGA